MLVLQVLCFARGSEKQLQVQSLVLSKRVQGWKQSIRGPKSSQRVRAKRKRQNQKALPQCWWLHWFVLLESVAWPASTIKVFFHHFDEWLEITKIRLEVDQYKIKIADSPLVDTSTFLATKYWEGKYSQETKEEPKGFEDCLTRWTPWTESERTISSSWSCWWKCCPINHWHWSTHCSTSTA